MFRLPCASEHWDSVYLGASAEFRKAAKHALIAFTLKKRLLNL